MVQRSKNATRNRFPGPHAPKTHSFQRITAPFVRNINQPRRSVDLQTAPFTLGVAASAFAFASVRLAPMSETFSTRYAALVAAGKIEADPGQAMLGPATDRA